MFDPTNPELHRLLEASRSDHSTTPILLDWLEENGAKLKDVYKLYCGPTPYTEWMSAEAVCDWMDRTDPIWMVLSPEIRGRIPKLHIQPENYINGNLFDRRYHIKYAPYRIFDRPAYISVECTPINYVAKGKSIFLDHEFWSSRFTEVHYLYVHEWRVYNIREQLAMYKGRRDAFINSFVDGVMSQCSKSLELYMERDRDILRLYQYRTPAQNIYFPERYEKGITAHTSWETARLLIYNWVDKGTMPLQAV